MAANSSSTLLFEFESNFNWRRTHQNVSSWWWPPTIVAILYVYAVFSGQRWMANRPRYTLRGPLILWNMALALFSVCGALRAVPELWHALNHSGFRHSVCDNSNYTETPLALWTWLFAFSKLFELGDTVFIVLRKQPLIFLHWYHHAYVVVYCFASYVDQSSVMRYVAAMNYSVHTVMYSYYFLRAMSVRIPRWVSLDITVIQLLQMVVGCYASYSAYGFKGEPGGCSVSNWNIVNSFIMYVTFLVLFAHFFYVSYIATGGERPPRRDDRPVKRE